MKRLIVCTVLICSVGRGAVAQESHDAWLRRMEMERQTEALQQSADAQAEQARQLRMQTLLMQQQQLNQTSAARSPSSSPCNVDELIERLAKAETELRQLRTELRHEWIKAAEVVKQSETVVI